MGVLAIGNDQNFTRPSDVGNNDPFPGFDHTRNAVRRLAENRIAGVANKTIDFEPTWNDVLFAHRAVFDSEFTKPSKLFAALDPSRYIGLSQELSAAQGTAFVDARAGVTWTFSANANGVAEAFVPTANGQVVVASAGADNIFAQTLAVQDPGLTAGNWIAINYTDANNHLRVYRQSATNVRVERVVSGTPTTELDTTVVAATDPVAGSALGIRRTGTACSVFLNGRRIANFTLSATAQGFAGTGVAFQTVTGGRTLNGPMEIHNNLNL